MPAIRTHSTSILGSLVAINNSLDCIQIMPESVVISVEAGSPAEQAGVRIGDVIETVDDAPPKQAPESFDIYGSAVQTMRMTLRRPGQDQPIEVTLRKASYGYSGKPKGRRLGADESGIGYIELTRDWGPEQHPTSAQRLT